MNEFLLKALQHGIEARKLYAAQAAGRVVIIPSAEAITLEARP